MPDQPGTAAARSPHWWQRWSRVKFFNYNECGVFCNDELDYFGGSNENLCDSESDSNNRFGPVCAVRLLLLWGLPLTSRSIRAIRRTLSRTARTNRENGKKELSVIWNCTSKNQLYQPCSPCDAIVCGLTDWFCSVDGSTWRSKTITTKDWLTLVLIPGDVLVEDVPMMITISFVSSNNNNNNKDN